MNGGNTHGRHANYRNAGLPSWRRILQITASRALAALLSMVSLTFPALASAKHPIRVTGRIVAYDSFSSLGCLNGNGYWTMIVRVSNASATGSEFIRIDFSLPCTVSPKWPAAKAPLQKFRLIRDKDLDGVLNEFVPCKTESNELCKPMKMWTFLSGGENDRLPFGRQLPGFRSVDLPLRPIL